MSAMCFIWHTVYRAEAHFIRGKGIPKKNDEFDHKPTKHVCELAAAV